MAIQKITASVLGNNAVTAANVAAGALSAADIADNSLTAAKLSTSTFAIDSLTVNTSDLVVDTANNRVGISTASPNFPLDVQGFISSDITSGNTAGVLVRKEGATKGFIGLQGGWEGNTGTDLAIAAETGGQIHLYTNGSGTKKVTIDASGNVGIGEDNPLQKLHVNSGTGNSAAIFESTDSTSQIWLKDSASSTTYQTGIACFGDNLLFNNGGEAMRIDSSGNVGIGVSSISTQGQLYIGASGTSTDAKIGLSPTNSSGGQNPLAQIGSTADGTYGSELYFTTRSTGGTVSEAMRIDSSGNVQIDGTEIVNNSDKGKINLWNSSSRTYALQMYHSGVFGSIGMTGAQILLLKTDDTQRIRITAPGTMYFYDEAGTTAGFTWDATNSRVGIGTTSPQTDLNIVNSSGATLDINTNTGGADSKILLHEGTSASPVNGASIRYDGANNLFKIGVGSSVDTTRLTIARDTGQVIISTDYNNPQLSTMGYGDWGNLPLQLRDTSLTNTAGYAVTGIGFGYSSETTAAIVVTDEGGSAAQSMSFITGTNTGAVPRMTIDESGKVGIGTTSPSEMLHILGGGSGPELRFQNASSSHYIRAYNDNWNFLANSTNTAMTIKNSGQVNFGAGIGIGGTGAANTLDDYEEGTFTPTVNSGGSSTSWAKYTKIGDTVFVACEIQLSGTRSSGYFIVSGLPFTNGNAWTPCSFYAQYYNNEGTQQASGVFRANTTDFYVHDFGSEAAGTDFGNGYFNFAGTYKIN